MRIDNGTNSCNFLIPTKSYFALRPRPPKTKNHIPAKTQNLSPNYFGGLKSVIFCQQTWHGHQRKFKRKLPKSFNISKDKSHCKLTTQSFLDHSQGGPLLASLRAHVAFCVISSRIISAYFISCQGAAIDAWAHALGESCLCDLTSGKESCTVGEQARN